MRSARSWRGRDKILKFEGGYHGMSDTSLQSLAPKRPGNFPRPVPDSGGIPDGVGDEVLVAPYNDLDAVADLIREHGDEIAGLIVEPVQRIIPPVAGFLEGLRELTEKHDIVLIFDEVVTGFRMSYGGAQEHLRGHPGPLHPRQGVRRRLPPRGHRGPGGDHVPVRREPGRGGEVPVPDRHPLGEPDRGGGRPRHPRGACASPARTSG